MKKNAKIEWTIFAKDDLKTVLKYYKTKSQQGYLLVKNAIIETVISASKSPDIFKVDNLEKDIMEQLECLQFFIQGLYIK